jgi:MFS family permease
MSGMLLVSFKQAVRSITLILLPLSFISLIAWATAGSSTGNTADPLRAALWFFLIAHHIPLDLSLSNNAISGALTYFPIGALLIPFLAIRSGYRKIIEEQGEFAPRQKRLLIISLAFSYATVGTILSLFATGNTVSAPFYLVFPILFIVAGLSAFLSSNLLPEHGIKFPWQRALKVSWIVLMALIGIGGVIFSLSLGWHFTTVLQLTQVIEPGIFGGLAFLAVQILYLPNFAIAALSYLAGSGVVIGNGSWLNPFVHRIDEIPAIPLLGGLPVHPHPYLILLMLLFVAIGFLIARYGEGIYSDRVEQQRFYLATLGIIVVLTLFIARASSGELLSSNLSSVGPQWWLMPIMLTLEIALGIALRIYLPILINKIRESRNATKETI